jgi:hypothetical protein
MISLPFITCCICQFALWTNTCRSIDTENESSKPEEKKPEKVCWKYSYSGTLIFIGVMKHRV